MKQTLEAEGVPYLRINSGGPDYPGEEFVCRIREIEGRVEVCVAHASPAPEGWGNYGGKEQGEQPE